MSDLIDRRELINQTNDDAENFIGHPTAVALHDAMVEYAFDFIKEAPAVEAEPIRHGKWSNTLTYGMIKEWNCTNCGASAPYKECSSDQYLSDYCPNCGAKMDGGAE